MSTSPRWRLLAIAAVLASACGSSAVVTGRRVLAPIAVATVEALSALPRLDLERQETILRGEVAAKRDPAPALVAHRRVRDERVLPAAAALAEAVLAAARALDLAAGGAGGVDVGAALGAAHAAARALAFAARVAGAHLPVLDALVGGGGP